MNEELQKHEPGLGGVGEGKPGNEKRGKEGFAQKIPAEGKKKKKNVRVIALIKKRDGVQHERYFARKGGNERTRVPSGHQRHEGKGGGNRKQS